MRLKRSHKNLIEQPTKSWFDYGTLGILNNIFNHFIIFLIV